MRGFGILTLLVAAGLAWLSYGDRRSSLALSLVELDGTLGVPLALVVGLIGLALVLLPRRAGRGASRGAPGRPAAPALPAAPRLETEGWLAAVSGQIGRLSLEPGASVQLDPGRTPPLSLRLERLTPERARRSVEVYAELLAGIPTPPRAAIRYEGCVHAGPPRHHAVTAALRRYFPADAFSVTGHEDTVEIVFRRPDVRWQDAASRPATG